MARVLCDQVTNGLRESEVIAAIRDVHDRRHFIRVERDFLVTGDNGTHYLPVGVVHSDPRSKAVLIELPHEAETGANRVWVRSSALLEPFEDSA
jgi:hypothetical protein